MVTALHSVVLCQFLKRFESFRLGNWVEAFWNVGNKMVKQNTRELMKEQNLLKKTATSKPTWNWKGFWSSRGFRHSWLPHIGFNLFYSRNFRGRRVSGALHSANMGIEFGDQLKTYPTYQFVFSGSKILLLLLLTQLNSFLLFCGV